MRSSAKNRSEKCDQNCQNNCKGKNTCEGLTLYFQNEKQLPEVFFKKSCFSNIAKFTGKHLFCSLFFHKVTGHRPATLLKKRLQHRCFPVNFAKFLRITFSENTFGRLLLQNLFVRLIQIFKYYQIQILLL